MSDWFPIRTTRLVLREFRSGDFADVHAYGSDPEVARYMPWGPNSEAETQGFLERALEQQRAFPRFDFGFAMADAVSDRVLGSMRLHLVDAAHRTAEIGYCLNQADWRRGLTHEAAHALIDVAFRALELHRVIATCDVRNEGSFAVMDKLGMRREALFVRDREVKDAWRDTYLYAVLAEEWQARG